VWKRVRASTAVKAVGMMAAEFADYDTGDNCRPGCEVLAAVCGEQMTARTVKKALAQMREWGLLWRYVEGSRYGRRGVADAYRLTLPADLLERVPMLTPNYEVPEEGSSDHLIDAAAPGEQGISDPLFPVDNRGGFVHGAVDNQPDRVISEHVISEHVISESGTGDLRDRNRCPQITPPIQDLSIDQSTSEAEGLDFASVENRTRDGEVKSGISFTSPAADVEAERRRQADALTAWEATQPAVRSA
jgi:hypothetical protein